MIQTSSNAAIAASLFFITFCLYLTFNPISYPLIFSPTTATQPTPPSTTSTSSTTRTPSLSTQTIRNLQELAINNTLTIVPVNTGMLIWIDNLLCSLSKTAFDSSKILFWALDTAVQKTLDNRGLHTYHNPAFYSVPTAESFDHDTKAFERMMLERPKFFIDMLGTGLDILFLDADTVFEGSPLKIVDQGVDVVFSSDSREFFTHAGVGPFEDERRRGNKIPPVCNGIFWMKSSERSIGIWQDMLNVFEDPLWRIFKDRFSDFSDDQRGMDVLLNDGRARMVGPLPSGIGEEMLEGRYEESMGKVKVRVLDQVEVVSGHLVMNRNEEYLEGLERMGREEGGTRKRLAVHFNWDVRDVRKEEGARMLGLWLLDGEGKCGRDGLGDGRRREDGGGGVVA